MSSNRYGAVQAPDVLEQVRRRDDRGAAVEPEAVQLELHAAAAQVLALVEQGHALPVRRQPGRRRQAAEAGSDHDRAFLGRHVCPSRGL